MLYYLIILNLLTFIAFGLDKTKSQKPKSGKAKGGKAKSNKSKQRIPESALFILAAIGGSAGAWAGMYVWHHKTKHKKFKYGIPCIFFIQLALMILL